MLKRRLCVTVTGFVSTVSINFINKTESIMNKTNVKLIPTCTAMVIGLTLFACSSKKQEGKKEEPGKMEMVDTKAVGPAPDPIKVFENVNLLLRNRIKGFVSDYFAIN